MYDVRRRCGKNPLCYDVLDSISIYLNRADVQKALKVVPTKYQGCNMAINLLFGSTGDWMKPFQVYVTEVLQAGVDVLIYAGDADFICNWLGNRAWTLALPWTGQASFQRSPELPWRDPHSGNMTGITREYRSMDASLHGSFTFLRVFGAGHMVPYDQPASSLDMVQRWTSGRSLVG